MDDSILFWAILLAFLGGFGFFVVVFVRASRLRRRHDEHLARHGIDGRARVVDARRSNFRVNSRWGWVVTVVWRDPHTGIEHRLESDLVFARSGLGDSPRTRLLAAGELPVRVDPAKPAQFHSVDTSSLRT